MFLMLWQTMYKVSDAGIILLKFLQVFLNTLGTISQVRYLIDFASKLPTTMYMVKAWLGLGNDEFEKCVACPKCHTLYYIKDCTVQRPNGLVSKRCSHVRYLRHPHRNKRRECGTVLMKTMRSKSGSLFLHPKLLYCYNKVSKSLRDLVTKPGFLQKCEELPRQQECMADVYHGDVLNGFADDDGTKFLSKPGKLGLMLNVDWFQPYKHTTYSCDVMYLVVMNLPRHERFKRENIIIAGIIPGPKEPKGNINSYLQPIVDYLCDLWKGVIYQDQALKWDGHGCSMCLKEFATSSFESKIDFSGYDTDNWELRTNEIHLLPANSALNASCKTQLQQVVRDTGARYSALYQLPYYDAVRFLVIDPMHCLFLGIAKHCLTLWKQEGLLSDKDFRLLQMRVDAVVPPPEIVRIPSKVATGFSGFSADQWKNWVCYYSLFALKGILPSRHYDLWSHYVSACRYMCSRSISPEQCANAEKELLEFCKGFQSIYGAERCTPNIHLSCHLGDCVKDYGPVYGFWCFSFERFNGIMGKYHKNNHNIGVQFMRKLTRDTRLHAIPFPDNCKEIFSVLPACSEGSVADTLHAGDITLQVSPRPPIKRVALGCLESAAMADLYSVLYPNQDIHCPRLCDSY
ncbi:uncharacterized protein LOC116609390 [Nematostella vectensis]|uniref:uncharacterized protein LOC116609390 n=1 Tax=Nematostella vectensis TaxID=45351 RepID=UPI00207781E5|nr:uncharacterized protein LOC116609390 [Nematostella vectensis]XP_048590352.1 uncharacterized protein LOC116609390 [Nematostella vectensis]